MTNKIEVTQADRDAAAALSPCPFCGNTDQLRIEQPFEPEDETSVVTCNKCNASGPYYGGSDSTSDAEAIELWSRRDRLNTLIEKAEASLPDAHRTRNDAQVQELVEALYECVSLLEMDLIENGMCEITAQRVNSANAALAAWEGQQ